MEVKTQALVLAQDTRETAERESHARGEVSKVHELLAGGKLRLDQAISLLGEASTIVEQVQRMVNETQQTSEVATRETGEVVSELDTHNQRATGILHGTTNEDAIRAQEQLRRAYGSAFQSNDTLTTMQQGFDTFTTQLERAVNAIPLAARLLGQVATRIETMDRVVVEQEQRLEESHGYAVQAADNLTRYGETV